jgi:hypothetical protein
MRRFNKSEKEAYRRSNATPSADIKVTPSMRRKVEELAIWLSEGDKSRVRATTQGILNFLCDAAEIERANLKLKDTAYARFRGKKAVWKLYGICDAKGTITVAFRTAVQRRVFAYKTFLNTVLHEFMHHYDNRKLRLAASFHTSGFYSRIKDLTERLIGGKI